MKAALIALVTLFGVITMYALCVAYQNWCIMNKNKRIYRERERMNDGRVD